MIKRGWKLCIISNAGRATSQRHSDIYKVQTMSMMEYNTLVSKSIAPKTKKKNDIIQDKGAHLTGNYSIFLSIQCIHQQCTLALVHKMKCINLTQLQWFTWNMLFLLTRRTWTAGAWVSKHIIPNAKNTAWSKFWTCCWTSMIAYHFFSEQHARDDK